ncbi:MAG: hypothetical protein JW952_02585 [Candidatus Eisenbacteria bacterium]|nr:hypothetical protein [Candidatus Eisenbacteria bacterium]
MKRRRATNGRTATLVALAAALAITAGVITADSAPAQAGRGGYERPAAQQLAREARRTAVAAQRMAVAAERTAAAAQRSARAAQRTAVAARTAERALRAVEEARMRRLMLELRPDPKQRTLIREAYRKGLQRRHELLRERAKLLERMRSTVGPARPSRGPVGEASEREMREMARRYREVERELAQTAWDMEDEIFERLSPSQKLRYIVLNERFDLELRQRIGALRQRGLGPATPVAPGDLPDEPSE